MIFIIIDLLQKFDYKIDEKYHHIILNPLDYTHVNHMYLTMVLVRYLWFKENDCLIDKINDILKTGEFNFTQALSIAHCYDIIDRDTTFNICFQNTFPVLDDINFNEIYYYGSYLLNTHIYRQSFNCFFDELDSSRNLAIFNAQLAMYLISEKIKEGADYNTVWKLMHSFKRISFNYVEDIKKNILITLKLFNKNETITEVQSDDLEIGKKYLLLSNNSLQNKFYVTYKGLTYPHRTNLHYYKTFNNDEINTRGTNFKFYRIDEKENTTI